MYKRFATLDFVVFFLLCARADARGRARVQHLHICEFENEFGYLLYAVLKKPIQDRKAYGFNLLHFKKMLRQQN